MNTLVCACSAVVVLAATLIVVGVVILLGVFVYDSLRARRG